MVERLGGCRGRSSRAPELHPPPNLAGSKLMDFAFSAEQEMLRDSARRFLAEQCPSSFIRRMMAHETAHDPELWNRLTAMGWVGLLVPEKHGGAGGSFLDLTVVLEEAGRALLPGPFFSATLIGPTLLSEGGSP